MTLPKAAFVALGAFAWSGGKFDQDAGDAVIRAALDEGLDLEAIGELEAVMSYPVDLPVIERNSMSKEDRVFVYAVARWIANLDGVVQDAEAVLLTQLAERLGLPERQRASADAVIREVSKLPDGDRPARYDLGAVRTLIKERLKPKT